MMGRPPKLEVIDLSEEEKDALINGILEILYPDGNLEHEHGSEELGEIANLLNDYHLVH
jgi:hypothetical protein